MAPHPQAGNPAGPHQLGNPQTRRGWPPRAPGRQETQVRRTHDCVLCPLPAQDGTRPRAPLARRLRIRTPAGRGLRTLPLPAQAQGSRRPPVGHQGRDRPAHLGTRFLRLRRHLRQRNRKVPWTEVRHADRLPRRLIGRPHSPPQCRQRPAGQGTQTGKDRTGTPGSATPPGNHSHLRGHRLRSRKSTRTYPGSPVDSHRRHHRPERHLHHRIG